MSLTRFAWESRRPRHGFTPSSSSCSSRSPCWPSWPSKRRRLLERDHHIDAEGHLIVVAVESVIRRMIPADFGAELQVRTPLIVGEWLDRQANGGFVNIVDGAETIIIAVVNPFDAPFDREHRIELISREQSQGIQLRIAAVGRSTGFPDVIHVGSRGEILGRSKEKRSIPGGSIVAVVVSAFRA